MILAGSCRVYWNGDGCLNKGPAAALPVTVASINELVSSTSESSFGRVLAPREPRNQPREIKVSGSRMRLLIITLGCRQHTFSRRRLGFLLCIDIRGRRTYKTHEPLHLASSRCLLRRSDLYQVSSCLLEVKRTRWKLTSADVLWQAI